MSLTINVNSMINQDYDKKDTSKTEKTVFAGNLSVRNNPMKSEIEKKKGLAQKQAMKLISDAWESDNEMSQSIDNMEKQKADKRDEIKELNAKISNLEDEKNSLMEKYNINPDSAEQKDLELLEKYQDYKNGAIFDENAFSKEEVKRLKELQNMPRTEYQNAVLKLNDSQGLIKKTAYTNQLEIKGLAEAVSDTRIEQCKSQEMVKATDAADEIIDTVGKEIYGELMQQGVDKIDEDMEDKRDEAEKIKEEKEEKEETIEESKERRKEQEEILEGAAEADRIDMDTQMSHQNSSSVEEAQKKIQRILKDNNLIIEDLKGIDIDFFY